MIPLYSTKQIRRIDDYAISKLGLPGIVLMENASREIFEKIIYSFDFMVEVYELNLGFFQILYRLII